MAKAECDRIMTINCLANPTQRTDEPEAHARASVSERFRRLKWNQPVWLATSLRMSAFFNCGQGGCSPSWLVCETNLREGRKRKTPTDLNQKNQNETQNIMAKLLKIAETKDVPPGQTAAFTVEGQKVALFNVEGTDYAIGDNCTHRGGPLLLRYYAPNRKHCSGA